MFFYRVYPVWSRFSPLKLNEYGSQAKYFVLLTFLSQLVSSLHSRVFYCLVRLVSFYGWFPLPLIRFCLLLRCSPGLVVFGGSRFASWSLHGLPGSVLPSGGWVGGHWRWIARFTGHYRRLASRAKAQLDDRPADQSVNRALFGHSPPPPPPLLLLFLLYLPLPLLLLLLCLLHVFFIFSFYLSVLLFAPPSSPWHCLLRAGELADCGMCLLKNETYLVSSAVDRVYFVLFLFLLCALAQGQ